MAKKTPTRTHCPHCDGKRTCDLHGKIYVPWDWEDRQGHAMNGGETHSLLQCRGCETVFYESDSWNSEDIDYWYDENGDTQSEAIHEKKTFPRTESKTRPRWLGVIGKTDPQLQYILNEMYVASENGIYMLAAIGLRTGLDRATEVLGIEPAISFEEKLTALQDGGWIGQKEHEILEVVTNAGHAAAHRGWAPDADELAQLLSALELFLQKAFIVGSKALTIKDRIPARPKRLPKPKTKAKLKDTKSKALPLASRNKGDESKKSRSL